MENEMTLLKHRINPVGSFGAMWIAAIVGLSSVQATGQTFLGDDPVVVSPKRLADDAVEVKMLPVPVQDKTDIRNAEIGILRDQLDKERLRRKEAEAVISELTESLAEANRVREEQTKAHQELQLKMQAFGVDLLKADPKSIEQRLLKAVRSLDTTQQNNEKLTREITALSEALVHYMQLAPGADEQSRQLAETSLRRANETLGATAGPKIVPTKKLTDGKVVSIDAEVGLIVLNIGRNSGARIGMPIEVVREDRPIGTAMVVDVREKICGAVLQELTASGDDVKIGDKIRPKPNEGA
ncbi:MAG: hypothetical protein HKN23_03815 [Verrucomicrobiales bacterium]|nr:hypothetical protein [Verrucomicrobiales bacterium]